MEELNNLHFIKSILMLLVVLGHSIAFWKGTWFTQNPQIKNLFFSYSIDFIKYFHTYCFVFISGYIYYYCKYEKHIYDSFYTLINKKIKRLIIPYYFVSLIWSYPLTILFIKKNIFLDFIIAISPGQLWFLWMLFNCFCFFYFLNKIFDGRKIKKFLPIIVILLYFLGNILKHFCKYDIFQIFSCFIYIPFFYLGFLYRKFKYKRILYNFMPLLLLLYIIFYVLILVIGKKIIINQTIIIIILKQILPFLGTITFFIILQKISAIFNQNNFYVSLIIKHSYTVFLLHQQIIYVTLYFFNGKLNPLLHALVNFIISILISIFISYCLNTNKYTRFLIGMK